MKIHTKIRYCRRAGWIILLSSFLVTLTYASSFRFIHYDIEDKLSSNTVRSILQDSEGFMWFGTEYGLNRFDGNQFKSFLHLPEDSTSLGNNYIYSMLQDSRGTFWIGTDIGIYLYDRETETFSPFKLQTGQGDTIHRQVSCIMEDRYGNIWFGTLGQGLFQYNAQDRTLKQFTTMNRPGKQLASDHITCLFEDSKGNIWITSNQPGNEINYFDSFEHTIKRYKFNLDNTPYRELSIYTITEDDDQNLWFGSWDNGLCKLNPKTHELQFYLQPENKHGIMHIHSLMLYQPDLLLIGSDDGMTCFNIRTHESELITATEFKDGGLSNKFVYPIYKDNEGGLWVGTYHGGINYAVPPKGSISGYSHSDYRNSVGGNIVNCFCEDGAGNIWMGSDDGGLSCFHPATSTFTNYLPDKRKNSISYYNIHALCLDDDKLWIGTYSGGLNLLDLKTKQFKLYTSQFNENTIGSNSIYSLFKDSDDTIWIGTMNGINRYNRSTDDFTRLKETGTTTIQILEDPKRNIWFATLGKGLYRYDKKERQWRHFYRTTNSQVNGMDIDEQGTLWIGTDQGLFYFKEDTEEFVAVPIQSASPIVCNIACINGYLWLGTMNGLVVYHPESNGQRVFYKSDGLQSDQFCQKASLLSSDGLLYLGTIQGFNRINPYFFTTNECIPPVKLTSLQIFNKEAAIGKDEVLHKSISVIDQIELSYKENVFSIEYAALSYCVPHKNQYKYKLEGFDKKWNQVGNQRKATYTNLPAGKYTFRVIGTNNDGIWNEKGASLAIVVHPPFWLSPFAYLFYFLSVIGAFIFLLYISRRKTEMRHKEKIKQLQADKEKEVYAAKINFFTLIAHEIRTPVSLIIAPLEKIMEQSGAFPTKVQDDLGVINRNSQRLLSLVNQLLDFRKAEQGLFVAHFTRQDTRLLLKNVYDRFKPLIEHKGITFELITHDSYEMTADVDGEAITKVISNLLTNASKYTKDRIQIDYEADETSVTIRVTDNGCGISEKEQKQIFRPFYQVTNNHKPGTGIGLSLVKLLVDAHHGFIEVESEPDAYTTFAIRLPKRQQESQATPTAKAERTFFATEKHPEAETIVPETSPAATPKAENKELPALLIIEDNPDMRGFLCKSFSQSHQVYAAENGKEGLNELKKHAVDLIISDVMMPAMDGISFCKEVKSNVAYSHIPLVLLTAKTDNESKITGMKIGADAYIEKPFSIQVLRAQIENLLESRRSLRKKFSEMPFVPIGSIAGNKADEQFLAKINELIEKNFSNPDFSIDKLAEQLCISRSGLFAKIKNLAGMTPNELIQIVRLKKAAELLSTGKYRINEICYQVGFNNPSYFSKCFQKQFGVLPKEFINKPQEVK